MIARNGIGCRLGNPATPRRRINERKIMDEDGQKRVCELIKAAHKDGKLDLAESLMAENLIGIERQLTRIATALDRDYEDSSVIAELRSLVCTTADIVDALELQTITTEKKVVDAIAKDEIPIGEDGIPINKDHQTDNPK